MKQTAWLAFSINRASPTPVFEQVCEVIRAKAISGDLPEGTKLPPTRVFATELGVSRSTIVTAYEQLVAEGYLYAVQGSAYSICAMGEVELATDNTPAQPNEAEEVTPNPRPFQAGQPDMRLFPHQQWARAVSRVCRSNPQAMLVGGSSFGNFQLRLAIARHVSEWRGIEASAHQIIITAGSTDALEICIRTLAGNDDRIGVEDPGYLPLRRIAGAQGLNPVFMRIDKDGATSPRGVCDLNLVVLTPSHQYPLGGAMSPNRRLEFIRWAERTNGWVIEDDYDSEFRYAGRPIPAMAGFDQLRRTIYIGSFSKIFSNALRLGYVIVPKPLIGDFRTTMGTFGLRASYMPQQALAEFIHSGEFYRHLRRVRRIYAERRKHLLDRISMDFLQYGSVTDHQAGMQIVLHLHPGLNDQQICAQAGKDGLAVQPLSAFCAEKSRYNGLLLGYCGFTWDESSAALDQLKVILGEFEGNRR